MIIPYRVHDSGNVSCIPNLISKFSIAREEVKKPFETDTCERLSPGFNTLKIFLLLSCEHVQHTSLSPQKKPKAFMPQHTGQMGKLYSITSTNLAHLIR
jgi:hypothetical protein